MAHSSILQRNAQSPTSSDLGFRRSISSVQRLRTNVPSALSHKARHAHAFTLLELLIVMGVLSVLLSILLPVFTTARKATLKARAKIQATALAQAVIQYKNVYGYWPGMVKASDDKPQQNPEAFSSDSSLALISRYSNEWLTVVNKASGNDVNYVTDNTLYRSLLPFDTTRPPGEKNANPLNPSRLRFIDLDNEREPNAAALSDPWGNQYIVVMSLSSSTTFDQEFRDKDTDKVLARLCVSNLTAFAISLGPEGRDSTNLIFSAGVPQ